MNSRTWNIIGWILNGIILVLLTASAVDKISGSGHALEITRSFGIDPAVYRFLGVVELTSALLFILPRMGLLGLLLLSSYLGGAIATHLQHGQSLLFPAVVEAVIWLTAFIRFSKLRAMLMKRSMPN